jgi:ribonuclease HI
MLGIYTDGSCDLNGSENATASSRVWFGQDDDRNMAVKLPSKYNTNNAGEIAAILMACQAIDETTAANIHTDSKYTLDLLTKSLQRNEDKDWSGSTNKPLLQAATAALRRRTAPTILTKVKAHHGIEGNEGADSLAKEGLLRPRPAVIDLTVPENLKLPGIRLSTASQSLIYKVMMSNRPDKDRKATSITIGEN